MVYSLFFRKPEYTPLPTNHATTTLHRHGRRSLIFITILFVCSSAVWAGLRFFSSVPYSPQNDYQNLDPPALVQERFHHPAADRRAVVSSLYSDSYAIGVAVLGHSIRSANVSSRLLLLYLEGRISPEALCITRAVGWEPVPVPFIPPPHNGEGIYYRFHDQYTKLNIWGLDRLGIERAVYLDADTVVRRNFDELFDIPFNFAAVPDVYGDSRGFTVNFNAGVLAFRPSTAVLNMMKENIERAKFPLNQAEQSFLNLFYATNVLRLPYAYNANLAIKVKSLAFWNGLKEEMRIVHYTLTKPFLDASSGSRTILTEEMQRSAIDVAARQKNGLFIEEVGWWREAYNGMMRDAREMIEACHR